MKVSHETKRLASKLWVLPISFAIAGFISACNNSPEDVAQQALNKENRENRESADTIVVQYNPCYPLPGATFCVTYFTDPKNGCEYLVTTTGLASQGHTVTPRIGSCDVNTTSTDSMNEQVLNELITLKDLQTLQVEMAISAELEIKRNQVSAVQERRKQLINELTTLNATLPPIMTHEERDTQLDNIISKQTELTDRRDWLVAELASGLSYSDQHKLNNELYTVKTELTRLEALVDDQLRSIPATAVGAMGIDISATGTNNLDLVTPTE